MKFEVTVECLPEDVSVRGNAVCSGDEEYDKAVEDKIIADLEFNPWAWCVVKVTATAEDLPGFEGCDYLGGCSYSSEAEFRAGGYFDDMKTEAIAELKEAREVQTDEK